MGGVVDLRIVFNRRRALALAGTLKDKTACLDKHLTRMQADLLLFQRVLARATTELEEERSFAAECQSALELGDLDEMVQRRDHLAHRLKLGVGK